MNKSTVRAVIMATRLEADPFIEGWQLQKVEDSPLQVFKNQDLQLILSGIGKANAAMAATLCCLVHMPDILFNFGAAGALDETLDPGAVLQVSRILEPDRPHLRTGHPVEHVPDGLAGFKSVTLATQDRPMISRSQRTQIAPIAALADMEAASIVQVCKKFGKPCHVFKFVSDTPAHLQGEDIVANIRSLRTDFFEFIRTKVLVL